MPKTKDPDDPIRTVDSLPVKNVRGSSFHKQKLAETVRKTTKRFKATSLTLDEAELLEQLIGDYLSEEVDDVTEIKRVLARAEVPKEIVKALLLRLEGISQDITAVSDDCLRMNIDAASGSLKGFDEWLGRVFKATDHRGRLYKWEVWS